MKIVTLISLYVKFHIISKSIIPFNMLLKEVLSFCFKIFVYFCTIKAVGRLVACDYSQEESPGNTEHPTS